MWLFFSYSKSCCHLDLCPSEENVLKAWALAMDLCPSEDNVLKAWALAIALLGSRGTFEKKDSEY